MNKKGFALILFLVYLLLFSVISCGICHMVVVTIIPVIKITRTYQERMLLHCNTDVFVRDVRMFPVKQWKKMAENEIIWNNGMIDIGWRYNDGTLERIEGVYNQDWKHKKVSLISSLATRVQFGYDYQQGQCRGVIITIIAHNNTQRPIQAYAAVRFI